MLTLKVTETARLSPHRSVPLLAAFRSGTLSTVPVAREQVASAKPDAQGQPRQ
jgi:hypothetical protein